MTELETHSTTRRILQLGIEQNLRVQHVVSDEKLSRIIGGVEALPSVPRTYHELIAAASSSSTNLTTLARLVESDPAMCLKVLQLVNTAFFGSMRRTSSIHQAIGLLGIEMLKGIVLTAHLFSAASTARVPGLSIDRFQEYSIRIGRLARAFVVDRALADEAFTAGILHDIGKLVLALRLPEKFSEVMFRVAETNEEHCAVERELIGVAHPEVGAYLMSAWGIPIPAIESVAFHHNPEAVVSGNRLVLAAVHAAEALTGIVTCGDPETRLNTEFLAEVGLLEQVPRWRKLVEQTS